MRPSVITPPAGAPLMWKSPLTPTMQCTRPHIELVVSRSLGRVDSLSSALTIRRSTGALGTTWATWATTAGLLLASFEYSTPVYRMDRAATL
jgi:hypothetical protein